MGEIQIPKDGFWAPIYYSMYVLAGEKPPLVISNDMYALGHEMRDEASTYESVTSGVDALSAAVWGNIQGGTADAFSDHVRGVTSPVEAQAAALRYAADMVDSFGLNGEEAEYDILIGLAFFAATIYMLYQMGPPGWAAVPEWIMAGRQFVTQIANVAKQQAKTISGQVRLAWSGVEGFVEESFQSFLPQAITTLNGNRKDGWDVKDILVAGAVGAFAEVNGSVLHSLANLNKHTRDFVRTPFGAGNLDAAAELPAEGIVIPLVGGEFDAFGTYISSFVMGAWEQSAYNTSMNKYNGQNPPTGGANQSAPPPDLSTADGLLNGANAPGGGADSKDANGGSDAKVPGGPDAKVPGGPDAKAPGGPDAKVLAEGPDAKASGDSSDGRVHDDPPPYSPPGEGPSSAESGSGRPSAAEQPGGAPGSTGSGGGPDAKVPGAGPDSKALSVDPDAKASGGSSDGRVHDDPPPPYSPPGEAPSNAEPGSGRPSFAYQPSAVEQPGRVPGSKSPDGVGPDSKVPGVAPDSGKPVAGPGSGVPGAPSTGQVHDDAPPPYSPSGEASPNAEWRNANSSGAHQPPAAEQPGGSPSDQVYDDAPPPYSPPGEAPPNAEWRNANSSGAHQPPAAEQPGGSPSAATPPPAVAPAVGPPVGSPPAATPSPVAPPTNAGGSTPPPVGANTGPGPVEQPGAQPPASGAPQGIGSPKGLPGFETVPTPPIGNPPQDAGPAVNGQDHQVQQPSTEQPPFRHTPVEQPAVHQPPAEQPAGQQPPVQQPAGQQSPADQPGQQAPDRNTPGQQNSGQQSPEQSSVERRAEQSPEQSPFRHPPVEQPAGQQSPADQQGQQAPDRQTQDRQSPDQQSPGQQSPDRNIPGQQNPGQQSPELSPSVERRVEQSPEQPPPVEHRVQQSSEQRPAEQVPVEQPGSGQQDPGQRSTEQDPVLREQGEPRADQQERDGNGSAQIRPPGQQTGPGQPTATPSAASPSSGPPSNNQAPSNSPSTSSPSAQDAPRDRSDRPVVGGQSDRATTPSSQADRPSTVVDGPRFAAGPGTRGDTDDSAQQHPSGVTAGRTEVDAALDGGIREQSPAAQERPSPQLSDGARADDAPAEGQPPPQRGAPPPVSSGSETGTTRPGEAAMPKRGGEPEAEKDVQSRSETRQERSPALNRTVAPSGFGGSPQKALFAEPPKTSAEDRDNTPARASAPVNGRTRPDTAVPEQHITPEQRRILDRHGVEAVFPGGDAVHDNFREAVARSVPDNAPGEHARITGKINDFAARNRDNTDFAALAHAADIRVHVLNPDGTWDSHGPETGLPVHIARSAIQGADTYLGTRGTVHIGRPGVSYPGSTVIRSGDRKRHVIHRGEFEVETIKGEHYVRLYTAVLNPVTTGSGFKDVHQHPDGRVEPFTGAEKSVFWAGGGRPLRAIQWMAKYEHDINREPGMQPVLRSYLVPLDKFTEISTRSVPESVAKDNELSLNTDQRGDVNQFGLRGKDFEQLQQHALKGSLVTYVPGGHDYRMREVAGRQEDIADLYVRLGLRPDFDSTALGRDNDPWFKWEEKNGRWQNKFRNSAEELRELAWKLGQHFHTWNNSAEAHFHPPGDSAPGSKGGPERKSPAERTAELNAFINTYGPGSRNVRQVADAITNALAAADDKGPARVRMDVAPDAIRIEDSGLGRAISSAFNDVSNQRAHKSRFGFQNNVRPSLDQVRLAVADPDFVAAVAEIAANRAVDKTVDQFARKVLGNTADEAELDRFRAGLRDDWVRPKVEEALRDLGGELGAEIHAKEPAKAGYLSGQRGARLASAVVDDIKSDDAFKRFLRESSPRLGREAISRRLTEEVGPRALAKITDVDLVGLSAADLKSFFAGSARDIAVKIVDAIDGDPVLKMIDRGERERIGGLVAKVLNDPRTLERSTFTTVTRDEVNAFMAKVPEIATQAEIGASIATDERRIEVDFNTRESALNEDRSGVRGEPFANEFGRWRAENAVGYTQRHAPGVFAGHRRIGEALSGTIAEQLADPDGRSAKTILDQLVSELDRDVTDYHDQIRRKFDELVARRDGSPYRPSGKDRPNTFGEHAQMVLNQYLQLTSYDDDSGRFVSRDALAKAILFHDMEKVNSKEQFGDAQHQHDREPEHRGAVSQLNRHEGLWNNRREFELARAVVDSDPFGFYMRDMGVDAQGVYDFVRDLAHRAKRPDGTAPTAVDVRNLFHEFHQYYQADFSSYTRFARFVNDTTGQVDAGYLQLKGLATDDDGLVPADGGRRYAYVSEQTSGASEEKFDALRKLFDDAVAAEREVSPVSAESFADDPAGEPAFVRENFAHVRGVNGDSFAANVPGHRTNCLAASIQTLNADAHPERAREFEAGPSGVVHRDRVPESGLPPMARQGRGYDDVTDRAAREEDGPVGLVYADFGDGRGHFFTVHKRGDQVVYFDGQSWSLAALGDPLEVWFSPVASGEVLAPVHSPVDIAGEDATTPGAESDRAEPPLGGRKIEVLDDGRTLPLSMHSRDLDDVEDPVNESRWMVPDGADVVRLAEARDPGSPNYRPGWDQLTPAQSWALMAAELRGAQFHERDRARAIARIRRLSDGYGGTSKAERAEIAAAAHEKLKSWPIVTNLFPNRRVPDGRGGQAPLMRLLSEGQPIRNLWETGVSQGSTDVSQRAKAEWLFGYSSAFQRGDGTTVADPAEMPRYSAVIPPSRTEGSAVQYGTVVLHWNDEVRARSTFTPGDSVDVNPDTNAVSYTDKDHLYPLLAYGDERLVRHLVAEATDYRYDPGLKDAPGPSTHDFLEAQIHGPLDLSLADKAVVNWGRVGAKDDDQPGLTRAEAEQLVADLRSAHPDLTVELGEEIGEPGHADTAERNRVRELYGLDASRHLDEQDLAVARELDRLAGGGPFAGHADRQDVIRLLTGDDGPRPDDDVAGPMLRELFDTARQRGVDSLELPGRTGTDPTPAEAPTDEPIGEHDRGGAEHHDGEGETARGRDEGETAPPRDAPVVAGHTEPPARRRGWLRLPRRRGLGAGKQLTRTEGADRVVAAAKSLASREPSTKELADLWAAVRNDFESFMDGREVNLGGERILISADVDLSAAEPTSAEAGTRSAESERTRTSTAATTYTRTPMSRWLFFLPMVPGLFVTGSANAPTAPATVRSNSQQNSQSVRTSVALPAKTTSETGFRGMRSVRAPATFTLSRLDRDGTPTLPRIMVGRSVGGETLVSVELSVPIGLDGDGREVPVPASLPASALEDVVVHGNARGQYRGKPLPHRGGVFEQVHSYVGPLSKSAQRTLRAFVSSGNVKQRLAEMAATPEQAAGGHGWVSSGSLLPRGNPLKRLLSTKGQQVQMRVIARRVYFDQDIDGAQFEETTSTKATTEGSNEVRHDVSVSAAGGPGFDVGMASVGGGAFASGGHGSGHAQDHSREAGTETTRSYTGPLTRYYTRYDWQFRKPGRDPVTFAGAVGGYHWAKQADAERAGISAAAADGTPGRQEVADTAARAALQLDGASELLSKILRDSTAELPGHHRWKWRDTGFVTGFDDPALAGGISAKKERKLARGEAIRDGISAEQLARRAPDMLVDRRPLVLDLEPEPGWGHDYQASVQVAASLEGDLEDLGPADGTVTAEKFSETESGGHTKARNWTLAGGLIARAYVSLAGTGMLTSHHRVYYDRSKTSGTAQETELFSGGVRGRDFDESGDVRPEPMRRYRARVKLTASGSYWSPHNDLVRGITVGSPGKDARERSPLTIVDPEAAEQGREPGSVTLDVILELPASHGNQRPDVAPVNGTRLDDVSINRSEELRRGASRKLDGLPIVRIDGLGHVRDKLRELVGRAASDEAFFADSDNSGLIDQAISLEALRGDRRAFNRKIRLDGFRLKRRRADAEAKAAVSLRLRDPEVLDTAWQPAERSVRGGSTTSSELGGTWTAGNAIEPAFIPTSETSNHTPGTVAHGMGLLLHDLSLWVSSFGHQEGHSTAVSHQRSVSGEPRRMHLISATVEATMAVETASRGNLDRWRLFRSKPVGRAAERFELPGAARVWVDDEQLHEIRIRQAEEDARRAAETPEPEPAPAPEPPTDPDALSPVPEGHHIGSPEWADGVTEPIDLTNAIEPLREQLVRRLGQEQADALLPSSSLDGEHDNPREAERYLSQFQASLGDLANGGTGTPLRLHGRLGGETYELRVDAQLRGTPEPVGIKHGELARASKATFKTSSSHKFTRVLAEMFTVVVPAGMFQNDSAVAESGSKPGEHGAAYGNSGLGLGHVFEWLKQTRQTKSDRATEHVHTETVAGALAEHRAEVLFDVRIERHGERIAAAPDTRTVTAHTPVEDTAIPDAGAKSRRGDIVVRSAEDATERNLAEWRAAGTPEVLPDDPAKFRVVDFKGEVADLVRAAERAIEVAGGEVDSHTRRMLRAELTPGRVSAIKGTHGTEAVPLELPPGLGLKLGVHPKLPGHGELRGASGRIKLGGARTSSSTSEAEVGSESANAVVALPFVAAGVPQHPDSASYPDRQPFGSMGDWSLPMEPLGARGSEHEHQDDDESGGGELPASGARPAEDGITSSWLHGAGFRFVAEPTSTISTRRTAVVDVDFEQGYQVRRSDRTDRLPAPLVEATQELAARDAEWTAARGRRRAADPFGPGDQDGDLGADVAAELAFRDATEAEQRAAAAFWRAKRVYDQELAHARQDPGLRGVEPDARVVVPANADRLPVGERNQLYKLAREVLDARASGARPTLRYRVHGDVDSSRAADDFSSAAKELDRLVRLAQSATPRAERLGRSDLGLDVAPHFVRSGGPTEVEIWLETPDRPDTAEDSGRAEFGARYPQLRGVNAENYARGLPGHTENCGLALIAAERSLTGGVAVAADAGGPVTVGSLREHFGQRAVEATFDQVDAHMSGQPGGRGAVFLRGPDGMVHGVLAETGEDGIVRYPDPQRGVMSDAGPDNVVGFLPLHGAEPLPGADLAPDLLVGMPAQDSGSGGERNPRRVAGGVRPSLQRRDAGLPDSGAPAGESGGGDRRGSRRVAGGARPSLQRRDAGLPDSGRRTVADDGLLLRRPHADSPDRGAPVQQVTDRTFGEPFAGVVDAVVNGTFVGSFVGSIDGTVTTLSRGTRAVQGEISVRDAIVRGTMVGRFDGLTVGTVNGAIRDDAAPANANPGSRTEPATGDRTPDPAIRFGFDGRGTPAIFNTRDVDFEVVPNAAGESAVVNLMPQVSDAVREWAAGFVRMNDVLRTLPGENAVRANSAMLRPGSYVDAPWNRPAWFFVGSDGEVFAVPLRRGDQSETVYVTGDELWRIAEDRGWFAGRPAREIVLVHNSDENAPGPGLFARTGHEDGGDAVVFSPRGPYAIVPPQPGVRSAIVVGGNHGWESHHPGGQRVVHEQTQYTAEEVARIRAVERALDSAEQSGPPPGSPLAHLYPETGSAEGALHRGYDLASGQPLEFRAEDVFRLLAVNAQRQAQILSFGTQPTSHEALSRWALGMARVDRVMRTLPHEPVPDPLLHPMRDRNTHTSGDVRAPWRGDPIWFAIGTDQDRFRLRVGSGEGHADIGVSSRTFHQILRETPEYRALRAYNPDAEIVFLADATGPNAVARFAEEAHRHGDPATFHVGGGTTWAMPPDRSPHPGQSTIAVSYNGGWLTYRPDGTAGVYGYTRYSEEEVQQLRELALDTRVPLPRYAGPPAYSSPPGSPDQTAPPAYTDADLPAAGAWPSMPAGSVVTADSFPSEVDAAAYYRHRFPALRGVNEDGYARGEAGRARNCGLALIAAERTLAGGVTVVADEGGPSTVGFLADNLGAPAVEASYEQVLAHTRAQPEGAFGAVLLRGPGRGMVHAVLVERGEDGVVRFADQHRGTMANADRGNVVGYVPLLRTGAAPLAGAPVDRKLLVGAPAGSSGLFDRLARRVRGDRNRHVQGSAERGGRTIRSADDALARVARFDQIDSDALADVLDSSNPVRSQRISKLAEKYGRNRAWARDMLVRAVGARLRAAEPQPGAPGAIAALAESLGVGRTQATGLVEAAAVSEIRAAADAGKPYSRKDLIAKFGYRGWDVSACISAAAFLDAREAAKAGRALTADELAGKHRVERDRAVSLVDAAAVADVRQVVEGGGSITADDLAARYGRSRQWAHALINSEPFWSGPLNDSQTSAAFGPTKYAAPVLAGAEESRARAAVRAAAADGQPRTAETLVEEFGKSREWAFDQIDAAAHADVIEAAGRGEWYDAVALAGKYGMNARWAHRQIVNAVAVEHAARLNAAEKVRDDADFERPWSAEALADAYGISVAKAADVIANAAKTDAYHSSAFGQPYAAGELAEKYRIGVESAREEIRAAARAGVNGFASGGNPYTANRLALNFRLSFVEAEQEIRSAAAVYARAVPGPRTPDELAGRYGKDRRWAFDRIGALVRSDADSGLFTSDDLADRYGISREAVEHRTGPAAAFADAQEAHGRGATPTAAELADRYGLSTEEAQAQIDAARVATVRAASDWILLADGLGRGTGESGPFENIAPGDLLRVDALVESGLSRERAVFLVSSNVVANLSGGHVDRRHTAEDFAEASGISAAEAEILIDTAATGEVTEAMLARRPLTAGALAARYGRTPQWATGRIETAFVNHLRRQGVPGGRHCTAAHLRTVARRYRIGNQRALDLINFTARADVRAAADHGEPYTAAELGGRYHLVDRWAADQIAEVVRADARAAANRDEPRTPDELARKYDISRGAAEEAIVAAVLADTRDRDELDVAALAHRYGTSPEVVDGHIDAVMRADVRGAADRRAPHTPEALAAKYGVTRMRAVEQTEAAALEYLADAAEARLPDDAAALVEKFGFTLDRAQRLRRGAASADARAAADRREPYTADDVGERYFRDEDAEIVAAIIDAAQADVREAARRGDHYTWGALARKYRVTTSFAASVIEAVARADVRADLREAAGLGKPYTDEQLAERYGMSTGAAAHEKSAAALAHAREARNSWEPHIADELVERYGISREEAERHVNYARHVPADSDLESFTDPDDDLDFDSSDEDADDGPQWGAEIADHLDVVSDSETGAESDDDWDEQLEPTRVFGGASSAPETFRAHYPRLWGVNAEKYARGVPGHAENCGLALIAAERTLTGGVTVAADAGGPMTVSALRERLGARAVAASGDQVEAHMGGQQAGARGAVFLRGPNGMVHGVLAETGEDGAVRYPDPHRGVLVAPRPDEVVGFLPLRGAAPLPGADLDPDLLVGAPADDLDDMFGRLALRLQRRDSAEVPGDVALDDLRDDVRSAANSGMPYSPDQLARLSGISRERAVEVIGLAAQEDVLETEDFGFPLTSTELARKYGIGRDWARELINDVREARWQCDEVHHIAWERSEAQNSAVLTARALAELTHPADQNSDGARLAVRNATRYRLAWAKERILRSAEYEQRARGVALELLRNPSDHDRIQEEVDRWVADEVMSRLETPPRLHLLEVAERYWGENRPGNRLYAHLGTFVRYLNEAEREAYRITIGPDGLLYDSRGELFHTISRGSEWDPDYGERIFVADASGRIYAGRKVVGQFHHSSFLAAGPASGAGFIKVDRGRIVSIVDSSGHYRPQERHTWQTVENFRRQGVAISDDQIEEA
ncbi:hypothetical protein [Saccharopolyspora sp. NPDC002376]